MESGFTKALSEAADQALRQKLIDQAGASEVKSALQGEERPRALEYVVRHKLKHESHAHFSQEGAGASAIDWSSLIQRLTTMMPMILQFLALLKKVILIAFLLTSMAVAGLAEDRFVVSYYSAPFSTKAATNDAFVLSSQSDKFVVNQVAYSQQEAARQDSGLNPNVAPPARSSVGPGIAPSQVPMKESKGVYPAPMVQAAPQAPAVCSPMMACAPMAYQAPPAAGYRQGWFGRRSQRASNGGGFFRRLGRRGGC
jgi:hypothetical protein